MVSTSTRTRRIGLRRGVTGVVVGAVATVSVMILVIAPVVGDLRRELRFQSEVAAAERDRAELLAAAIDQETGQRGFLLTGGDFEEFLVPYFEGRVAASEMLARLGEREGIDGLGDAVDAVERALSDWQTQVAEPQIDAIDMGVDIEPLVLQRSSRLLFDQVRDELDELAAVIDAEDSRTRERIADTLQQLVVTVLVVYGIGTVACLGVWWLLRQWITAPVDRLVAEVRRVSSGQFEEPLVFDGPVELQAVAGAADAMRYEIVQRLQEVTRAHEALEQRAPAVLALRDELEPSDPILPAGIEVVSRYEPAEGLLAGDFSDVLVLPDGRVAVVVADTSGHGAEVVARALRAKHLLGTALATGAGPASAMARAAPRLGDDEGWFVSALVVVASPDGTITWSGAGHPPCFVRTGETLVELASTGPVLGPVPGPWEERTLHLPPPWVALLVTDGLLEARNDARAQFGEESLRQRLRATEPTDPDAAAAVVEGLLDDVRAFVGADRTDDDVTVVAIRVAAPEPPPAPDMTP
jgi:sigma-B regulation protein RsbU (phosphoserine phosphatase)